MKKVGFFGGSFDPIHLGHLQMARELKEKKGLDEVWFSPASISPFKLNQRPAAIEDRLEMVRLGIENYQGFILFDREAKKSGPSFTIDILREITQENPNIKFFLIMSDESVPGFYDWKEVEAIVDLVPLLIGSREAKEAPKGKSSKIEAAIKAGWVPTNPVPISSTEIRNRLAKGENCSDLLPKKVLDYIHQNHLYYST